MNDDELILRRKKQNADRARAYRKRLKDLDAMPSISTVQSGEPESENIVTPKYLHQKQLNAERCRRYRQKCKQQKSGANFKRGTSSEDSTSGNNIKLFCPKCNTEVSHIARAIEEDLTKILIAKVYHYFEQEYEELKKLYGDLDLTPLSKFYQRTALATGVSETTLLQILKEEAARNADRRWNPPQERRAARKRRRQTDSSSEEDGPDDNVDDIEQGSHADDEEPEIFLKTKEQLQPGSCELNKAQLQPDPIVVKVKIEPRDDEVDTAQLQPDPIAVKVKTEPRDDEVDTAHFQADLHYVEVKAEPHSDDEVDTGHLQTDPHYVEVKAEPHTDDEVDTEEPEIFLKTEEQQPGSCELNRVHLQTVPHYVELKTEPHTNDEVNTESTKASKRIKKRKTNAQKCREYRERKKLQNTMVQNKPAERTDACSGTDQLQVKRPKTNAERRKKHYEAQKLKKQGIKKIPKTAKQRNKEYYERKKRKKALNILNKNSDPSNETLAHNQPVNTKRKRRKNTRKIDDTPTDDTPTLQHTHCEASAPGASRRAPLAETLDKSGRGLAEPEIIVQEMDLVGYKIIKCDPN